MHTALKMGISAFVGQKSKERKLLTFDHCQGTIAAVQKQPCFLGPAEENIHFTSDRFQRKCTQLEFFSQLRMRNESKLSRQLSFHFVICLSKVISKFLKSVPDIQMHLV